MNDETTNCTNPADMDARAELADALITALTADAKNGGSAWQVTDSAHDSEFPAYKLETELSTYGRVTIIIEKYFDSNFEQYDLSLSNDERWILNVNERSRIDAVACIELKELYDAVARSTKRTKKGPVMTDEDADTEILKALIAGTVRHTLTVNIQTVNITEGFA